MNITKVKFFRNSDDFTGDINNWLENNPNIKIEKIIQTESKSKWGPSLTVSIWYRERKTDGRVNNETD